MHIPPPDAPDASARLRWAAYGLLITIAVGQMTGRILAVNSVDRIAYEKHRIDEALDRFEQRLRQSGVSESELPRKMAAKEKEYRARLTLQRPFLSANDRSRWVTVRALVEHGTYAIDEIISDPEQHDMWQTVDMVKHRDRSGEPRLYSSKPPLMATLMAGEYWLIRGLTGWTLRDDTFTVVRIMVLSINVLPLLVMFVLLARWLERYGTTDWGRLLVMAAATLGTFLTTFAMTINNHLIAAVSALCALYVVTPIWFEGERRLRYFVAAGFFAAFTAANELPALSLFALLTVVLLWKMPRPTLLGYVPPALLVTVAFFGTNYLAHQSLIPPYMHRQAGEDWESGNWYNFDYKVGDRVRPGYWKEIEMQSKIDRGETSAASYALHVLVGHHGIFSLTPLWLLSVAGLYMMWRHWRGGELRDLAIVVALVSAACLFFYLTRGQKYRNYGGMTSGFRWVFWMIPLWLMALLPAADWTSGSRWRRMLAAVLLGIGVLSASYPTWNPWSPPWLQVWMEHVGWVDL